MQLVLHGTICGQLNAKKKQECKQWQCVLAEASIDTEDKELG